MACCGAGSIAEEPDPVNASRRSCAGMEMRRLQLSAAFAKALIWSLRTDSTYFGGGECDVSRQVLKLRRDAGAMHLADAYATSCDRV